MFIFEWLNNQLLKMDWLYDLVIKLVENVFGLEYTSKIGNSVHFFIYDTIKIFILLSILIFGISYIQSFFPPERTRRILSNYKGVGANIMGALFGTITPFCSCSSIPIFIGFTNAGLPIGVTFSFLISSPFVDLASVILLASIFNWKIAIAYVVVGVVLAVIGGTILEKTGMEKYVESFVYEIDHKNNEQQKILSKKERLIYSKNQVLAIVSKVWAYILIGVGIGALIHNYIPQNAIETLLGEDKFYSVIVAAVAGVPMYADIFGTLPIAQALVEKGVGIGTALTFMMGVTALSLPSLILLKKVVKTKLILVFTGIITMGIIIIGYIFNAFGHVFI